MPGDLRELHELAAALGRSPDLVMWYVAWSTRTAFPAAAAERVAATGAVPVVTWEPWDPAHGVDQPAYSLDRVAAGAHSTYVATWAGQIKAYGGPLVLRFAHEMNGTWYPWAARTNGNTAADYVAAWREVRSVFLDMEVANVSWSWSPNVPYPGSAPLAELYPGDAFVDGVAIDGYNGAHLRDGGTWTTFEELFAPGIEEVMALTSRPLSIGETGAPEVGGDKAAWVAAMFASLARRPEIRGFTWFSHHKEADWRIDSSLATLEAFRTGLAGASPSGAEVSGLQPAVR